MLSLYSLVLWFRETNFDLFLNPLSPLVIDPNCRRFKTFWLCHKTLKFRILYTFSKTAVCFSYNSVYSTNILIKFSRQCVAFILLTGILQILSDKFYLLCLKSFYNYVWSYFYIIVKVKIYLLTESLKFNSFHIIIKVIKMWSINFSLDDTTDSG